MSSEQMMLGLDAPICLNWEITYACNLRCIHCLSSSAHRRTNELTTAEAKRLIDQWAEMQVFYVNVGGGEPTLRLDFIELTDYCLERGIGVKVSTNGIHLDEDTIDWMASREYFDLQISLDGADEETNDRIRGRGSYLKALRTMERLARREILFKINAVVTRDNLPQMDNLLDIARRYGARLRLSRLRPTGRARDAWEDLRPTRAQNQRLYGWLVSHPDVLTGDSFFHLSAHGVALQGLGFCGAGRVICSVDPVGNVYPCPFLLDPEFYAGNVRQAGGFRPIWDHGQPFLRLRREQVGQSCRTCAALSLCRGGCIAVKLAGGLDITDPDPDCVLGTSRPGSTVDASSMYLGTGASQR